MARRFGSWLAVALAACQPTPPKGSISLLDDAGRSVVLSQPARRIVSLIPATTELFFALGAGRALVGRTRWCDFPPAAEQVQNVGDGMSPNVEAVLETEPDLVVIYKSPSNQAAVSRLRGLGVAVLEVLPDRWSDFERITRLLAEATGRRAAGDSLLARVGRALDSVTVKTASPRSVFVLAWEQPPMTLGAGSFLTEIIARAGGRNLFADENRPSFVVAIEAVVARDPDLILVVGTDLPSFISRPEWQAVRAVRDRRFVRIAGSMFNRPSPRMPLAVATLARELGSGSR